MKLNLIVLYSTQFELIKEQYELLGLCFEQHQHNKGLKHYAAELVAGQLLEIYPSKSDSLPLRIGFEVEDLEGVYTKLLDSSWQIKVKPKLSEWGYRMVIEDLDGRKVELLEK